MIVVVQHTSQSCTTPPTLHVDELTSWVDCASSTGDVEANIRSDVKVLKDSPYVRNEIPVIGYVLDIETGQLREVKYVA